MLSEERFTFHTPYIMILVTVVSISVALTALEQQHAEGEVSANDALDKFEGGFYDKIQGLIHETAAVDIQIPGDVQGKNHGYPAARDPVRYYHIIIQIDGDGEEEVRLNKRSAVDMLEAAGARDIVPADVLSFVTASVPVTEISGLSLLGEVHMLGDGEIPTISQTDTARQTIRAATADLAGFSENIINGSGVTVAIIDHGIYHVNLNSKVDARIYCPTGSCTIDGGSNPTTLSEGELDKLLSNNAVHGTLVSQIVAASDLPAYNGIAPGVRLLDGYSPTRGAIIRALDWALTEGADVAQLSISVPSDTCVSSYVLNAAINQAVSKGMVVVSAAGNDGKVNNAFAYHTVEEPSCAQNVISVGGINDRPANPILYLKSSLGPVTSTIPRLVPHLVAPAYGINVLAYSSSSNHFYAASGTSFAAPMVSAAAAMMLQLNPDLAPAETKSLLLLGSDWTGPVPCTSTQYEAYNPSDNCSHTARQDYGATPTLETLNHVGFGVLDVAKSLRYAANSSSHVISSNLDSDTRSMWYGLNVTEPLDQTKVSLTWLVPFFFNHNTIDLDFTVTCPGSSEIIRAKSNHQTVEFAVFEPVKARVCAVHITTPHSSGIQNFTLASTHPLGPPPSEFIESDIVVSSDDDGTYVLNERIVITAEFPRAVQVKSTSQPYLELNMTSAVRHATYTGINADGTVLSFEYAMQEGDASADLSYTGMNALVVPDGGNVTDAYTGIPVRPVLSVPGEAGSLSATRDIVINTGTGAPSITAVTLHDPTSQITSNTALVFGVTFSESVVNVDQSDFVLSSGSGTVTGVTGTGSSYLVNVAANSDGIFDLDMSLSNDVQDISNNDLSNVDPRTSNDQTYTVSSTAPSITAITRHDPISQTTLVFEVMFSEDVTGVDAADFALSPGSTGAGSIVSLTGSGSRYLVSVSATQDGTYNLDLVSPGHGIVDATNSPLAGTDPIGDDYTYTVDTIAPTVTSIERNYPTEQITDSQMLVFEIAFNENVAGVDAADFVISPGSTGEGNIANLTGSGNKYLVDVSATQDGTYNLDLVSSGHGITDIADNPLTDTAPVTEIDHTYTVNTIPADTTAPTLESIQRSTPATANTDSQTLVYKATFSEDVTGITVSDFTLSSDSAGGESTSTSTGQFTQTRSPNLDIPDLQTVSDTITVSDSETATSVSVEVDITHTYIGDLKIDLIAPDGISRTLHDNSGSGTNNIDKSYAPLFGSIPISGVWTLQIHDNYDADPGVLNSWTLTINYGDTATTASSVTGISGSGDAYYVTVSATQDGTYNLDLVSSGHDIEDAANNSLTNVSPTGADETYTVSTAVIDDTAPTLESIQRSTPATANTGSQTLVYKATFSEDVTGITVSDFTLSSDSAGGESTSTSTGQFTQTRSPNLDILDLATVSDTITVPDSETATSVSVEVDITHTYIGDLKIDLIAPDGISRTLHDNSGSGTNNIDKSYAPLFGSIPISGVWTLQIHDNYDADPGVLNSWTLTINYGDTATTASSVTGISGSGDAYYVTVSATQDGTYNLDLVSSGHDIEDAANNSLTNVSPTGADETYTVSTAVIDDTAPTLESIQRSTPATANTGSQTLVYKATFSEDVTGITVSDFTLSSDSAGGESTSTSTGQFTQTRSPNLDILDLATVSDTITVPDSETATSVSVEVDITHTYIGDLKIDLIAPDGISRTLHDNSGSGTNNIDKSYAPLFGSIPISGVWTLQIHDNYDADPGVLNSWTLTINYGDTATTASSVTGISGSGDAYYVTVSATQDGAYNLDLVSSGHDIEDAANNSLTNVSPTGADETYTVSTAVIDDTAPTLESIERSTPATQDTDSQTLVYKATFSEDVTGITVSDFTLSSDSAGGESTSTSTGQFTQTRSPHLTILDLATVSDTITVPDSETATSVSVEVDITHTYIGDLKIDLIAPDGISRTLHDNSGSGTNNIDKSYAPLFGSIPISGVWTLQIHDNYDADPGVLNSWTLTINYGDTATTASSVTGISGSGDAYYVTVSATQDGTYNLDLVSSGHDIEDAANNSLTNVSPTGADETYTVSTAVIDDTAPTLESIQRSTPATANTGSQTLVYKATFSEDVTGITVSDFTLSSDSAGGESTSTSTGQFTQTRSPNLDILDLATVSDTITVPDSETATSVSVEVDITHTYIGDLKIDLIAPDGISRTLHDNSGSGTNNIDKSYAPLFGSIPISGVWTLQIHDNYDADPGVLNSWTLTINYGDTATTASSVTGISGSGDAYYVTVSATQDGTYNLDLVSSGHDIEDAANNSLTNVSPTGADETYTVSTAVIDDTAPTLESIQRSTPATANTGSQTLVYKATFSEDVTGITVSDFTLSSDSAGGESTSTSTGQFTQTRSPNLDILDLATVSDTITVPDSETATSVSVEVDITHTYIGDLKIDLIAPDGISRTLHDNSGSGTNNIDKSYAPLFGSIPISGVWTLQIHDNYDADPGVLNSWTLTINYGDTATTASSVTGISGSGDAYYVTVSATQDGAYNLDLVSSGHDIEDAANNSLTNVSPTGADETYTVSTAVIDDTAPTLESIERSTPATQDTDSQTLVYKATFSEDVTGITVSDFTLSSDSAGGESTSTSTGQFTQTRSPHLTILDLATVSDTITVPDSETATSVSVDVGITHNYIGDLKIDLIAPDGTSRTLHDNSGSGTNNIDKSYAPLFGSIPISGVWTLQIHDNYDADPGVLNSWTLTINYGDTATTASSVTDVSGSGDAYYVTVSATQDGAYNLDLVSSGHDIEDAANNSLTNVSPTGADETYTVSTAVIDDTAPTLESIERSTPATQDTDSQTLVYKATFSEDVTGITVSDFTLSSDSAGGESTSTSTGQFTQTRSPHLTILDLATVSDTITVPDSETATSVSVDVGITHNYIGDLKIDLIAPDGTSRTLHDNSGSGTNNIDKSYAPLFGSIPISGVWTLQIHDNYDADPGVLNSWTLTINYGDTATTASSVTDVSGSGDAYYVTVSATQDGAYNLDLVSSGHDIEDAANNSLTNASPTGADETYTVSTAVIDDTAPTLASIERYSPATENTDSQTLVYEVTFSEDVTEVDTDDFALSSDSTGGGNNNNAASSEQFTQTRSPSSPITDNHDTSDAITVPNSGTVTSVSVTVNISHTYIGDLKVELVAPDGTLKTLHNRSGGGTDNIITPYTPDFDDAQIQGIWKLKIRDGADGDTGTLNSWTLEVNYDTVAATTVSSVTDISGSGDVYHVTVSATQDGTYNLDLVSSGHNIADAASNPLTNTTPTETDETYTVTTN